MSGTTPAYEIPRWIMTYSIIAMVVMPVGLAIALLIDPLLLPVEISQGQVFGGQFGLLGTYVARYFAVAVATSFALYQRSPSMLLLIFVIRIINDLLETSLSTSSWGLTYLLFTLFVYWLPCAFIIKNLWISASASRAILPKWITIYAVVIMVGVSMGLPIMLLIDPGEVFPELAGVNILAHPTKLFVIMNMTGALAAAFVLYFRSASMMLLLFMIQLLTDIPDYIFSVISGDYLFPFVFFLIFVNWLPSIFGVRSLWFVKN